MRNSVAGEPVKGEEQWKEVVTNDFIVKGCMTSNGNSKVIIKVSLIVNYNYSDHGLSCSSQICNMCACLSNVINKQLALRLN